MSKKITVYQIESDVPMPKEKEGTSLPPIRQLQVGESIVFPLEKRNMVQSLASRIKRENGFQYKVQKQNDETARIWRVE